MRTMDIPVECPIKGPAFFIENYDTITKLLVEGKTTTEIGDLLDKKGVDTGYDNARMPLSNVLSGMIKRQKFPDFPQIKGFEHRTNRRKKPSCAYIGLTTTRTPTTTIESEDTVLNGRGVTTRVEGFEKPFDAANRKLAAIDRVLRSTEFDETSKLKYIKAELNN